MITNMDIEQMIKNQNNPLYNILITSDNFFRKLNENVDFSFIREEIQKNYSESMGRPSFPPEILFKLLLLKVTYKLSDRDLMKRMRVDMEFKYFAGYAPEDVEFVDPSLLSKFRTARLQDSNLLDMLIGKTVEIALQKGVLSKRVKIIVDSTHTNALYQHVSPREELIKRAKDLRKAVYAVDSKMKEKMPKKREASGMLEDEIQYCKELIETVENEQRFAGNAEIQERLDYLQEGMEEVKTELEFSKEQEARIGHKTADTSFFGYKSHIAMTPERIITAATVTTGEKHDGKQLPELIHKTEEAGLEIEAVIGDGAYSEKENIEFTKDKNIKLAAKLSECVTHGLRKGKEFEFNKDSKMYVCPAGHEAVRKAKQGCSKDTNGSDTRVMCYHFDVEKCKVCPLREGCYKDGAKSKTYSVKIKSDIHVEQMDYEKTEEFEQLYEERYKIEAKNAELKNEYGYADAQSCGKLGMTIQCACTMFLVNLKRINKLVEEQ